MARRVSAEHDQTLTARVIRQWPLYYCAGADPANDRPAHVRAGSGLALIGRRLAVIQDDAQFVAVVDLNEQRVEAIDLPTGHCGGRQFDDVRGNKCWKLDLEACTTVVESDRETLLALGSGSSPWRESILVAHWPPIESGSITLHNARAFYNKLRSRHDFAGSELNIEGAVFVGDDSLRLLQRGNGVARDGRLPVNAICNLSWQALRAHLNDPTTAPPELRNVIQYDLGLLDGVRLCFTDGAVRSDTMFFTATAEDSCDAVCDGPVAGSVLGQIGRDGAARWTLFLDRDGRHLDGKVEGLCLDPEAENRAWILMDRDDPLVATDLCQVELQGDWNGFG